jgi:hypothetical protein
MRHDFSHLTSNEIDFGILEQQSLAVLAGIQETKTQLKTSEARVSTTSSTRTRASQPKRRAYVNHCWKCSAGISSNACNRCSRCQFYCCPNCNQCLCGKVNVVVFPRVVVANQY